MDGILFLGLLFCVLAALGILESLLHRARLSAIPLRIHVNGTRGKSSVTRLIAAGLREGGIRTCAKTTGTLPCLILPDGSEEPVRRKNGANIIEQLAVVRRAVQERADAMVVECMAVHPLLQSVCELKLICSTHGVITNARPDHLDKMGPTARDVARALAGTVPVRGILFTSEQIHLQVFRSAARDRGSRLFAISDDDVCSVTADELDRFSYLEHPENVALALEVCLELGIDRATALRGMALATPDVGALTAIDVSQSGRTTRFINAFAANDPESTAQNWNFASRQMPFADARIAVINCRDDRPDRSLQLADMCVQLEDLDHLIVIGTATEIFTRRAIQIGVRADRIGVLEQMDADELCEHILSLPGYTRLVVGMGNICGIGMDLVHQFSLRQSDTVPAKEYATLQEAA